MIEVFEDLCSTVGQDNVVSQIMFAIQGHRSKVPKPLRFQRTYSQIAVPESRFGEEHLVRWLAVKYVFEPISAYHLM